MPPEEQQSITRVELCAVLLALDKKTPGLRLHVVADIELVFLGL